MTEETILWRRIDRPGHESARLTLRGGRPLLKGSAVFLHEGEPCRLDYRIACDASWATTLGTVTGWLGGLGIGIEVRVEAGKWRLNGSERPDVEGAVDLDLNFSPSTNLLPIRRLGLKLGEERAVRAAWLRFPSFELEPLEQTYRRLGETTYRYESAGGFVRKIEVRPSGLVTLYPDFFQEEPSTSA